jgi:hypothetical protein
LIDHHGKFITVNEYNHFFNHVTKMLMYHFDTEAFKDTVFVLGSYCAVPYAKLCEMYPNKKVIIYQLEQLFSSSDTWQSVATIISNLRGARIWDYDELNATYLSWNGINVERVLPLLHTPTLVDIPKEQENIDVLFYGYMNERRFKLIRQMEPAFYGRVSLVWLYGVGYEHLKTYIARSKIILNLHMTEPYNRQEQVRMFYPLMNEKCIVSEPSQKNYLGDSIIESNNLGVSIVEILSSNSWGDLGSKGARAFKSMSYKRSV